MRCIRCGACLNACPVYRKIGGHAYGSVYPGPIGALVTPLFQGLGNFKDLPQASSLCGACYEACPVKINIPKHLINLRRDITHTHLNSAIERALYRIWAWSLKSPLLYKIIGKVQGWDLRRRARLNGWVRRMPKVAAGWTQVRDMPAPATKSFHQLWRSARNDMEDNQPTVLDKVRRALGRSRPLEHAPTPPVIDESIARLVHGGADLSDVFVRQAAAMKMKAGRASREKVGEQLIAFLRESNIKKIAVASSPLLEELNVLQTLRQEGFEAASWSELSLDQIYDDIDCGITDVTYAVAETGSLAIEPAAANGRALSLVPLVHVAIVEPKVILPDLLDLMAKLAEPERDRSNIIMITGPSKTADIEMNVVTGVHGPNVVKVVVLE